jgi:predicted RNA-binding protein with PUA-like domain
MAHWILKSEPDVYPWDQMVRDGITPWDGVRNYQARNFMKQMAVGDLAFFYHSGAPRCIVGWVSVCRPYYPDVQDPDFGNVDVQVVAALPRPVTLAMLKIDPVLSKIAMVRQSRLSVSPITQDAFDRVQHLGGMTS